MKNIFFVLLFSCLSIGSLYAQAPEKIKFQAIVSDTDGDPISNPIEVRLSLTDGLNGPNSYVDEQVVTPNEQGVFSLLIGDGPVVSTMANVPWTSGSVFLKVEVKTTLGGAWELLGDPQQMLSVPYAIYGEDADANPKNELQQLSLENGLLKLSNDGGQVPLPNEIQQLSLVNGVIKLSKDGGEIPLPIAKSDIISFNARGLNFTDGSIISAEGGGLTWTNSFSRSASLCIRKPSNYNGGEVSFKIFYRTTSATKGTMQFFIRPRSFNSGDGLADAPSILAPLQSVIGQQSFGTLYEQEIKIPKDRLTKDWWFISIQRNSSHDSPYPDDVVVYGVALEFDQR